MMNQNHRRSIWYDRFIPDVSAIDFEHGQYVLRESRRVETKPLSASREAFNKQLARDLGLNRPRVLSYNNKPPLQSSSTPPPRSFKPPPRYIPKSFERKLDLPGLVDDVFLNLLDWGSSDVLAIALADFVYLWDAPTRSVSKLFGVGVDEDQGPVVTSLNWSPGGLHIAVGFHNSKVEIWNSQVSRLVTTLDGCHESRVGSLAWNQHALTSGGMDGLILNHDVRVPSSQAAYRFGGRGRDHTQEVCGLKWSESGDKLASCGRDSVVRIWDSSSCTKKSLYRFRGHTSEVKALDWCPFQTNLLATGGHDGILKFWNTSTGACLNSVDAGSHVSSLLWSNKERELLCSHGNQLTLFKYPSMVKMAELTAHDSRVLFMTPSPNNCTVATAGAEESLKLWDVLGDPKAVVKKDKAAAVPFSRFSSFLR